MIRAEASVFLPFSQPLAEAGAGAEGHELIASGPLPAVAAHTGCMWWRFLRALKGGEHRVAPTTWIAAAAAVVYAISPIDVIPELVLGPLGLTDDLGVWGILAVLLVREHHRWQTRLQSA